MLSYLKNCPDITNQLKDVDGCPGHKEIDTDQNQHLVCFLSADQFPCFADGCETAGGVAGHNTADHGVKDTDNNAGDDVLDKNTDDAVDNSEVVGCPVLKFKFNSNFLK